MSGTGRAAADEKGTSAPSSKPAAGGGQAPVQVEGAAPAITPFFWTAEGKKAAEELAETLRKAGIPCTECDEGAYGFFDPKVTARLPVPRAVISCTGQDDEDITFDIFSNAEESRKFVTMKQEYICRRAYKYKMTFYPGFPFINGGTWVVEPDDMERAEVIAKALGGKAELADCKGLWPTPTPKPTPVAESK